MELVAYLYNKPTYTKRKVLLMKVLRYLQTGILLHLMAVFSILMAYFVGEKFLILLKSDVSIWKLVLYAYLTTYFITLIFFSQLDARSRYQNYKMVKDKIFEYGFDARLLKPFVYSRCQRDAIGVAAKELGFRKEWIRLINELGFRWYHILPFIITQNPGTLFKKAYWSKTLFVRTYHSKYYLW